MKSKVAEAQGDASRFLQVYEQYKSAKDITRKRLYIETMEQVLPKAKKVIVDPEIAGKVLPLLPLDQVQSGLQPAKK